MSLLTPHPGPAGAVEPSGEWARVLTFPEPGTVSMRMAQLRRLGDDEVMVETRFSSIAVWAEQLLFSGRLPGLPQQRFPLVPGNEAAGIVIATGKDIHDVRVGDEVFVGGSSCFTDVAATFGGQSSTLIKKASQVVLLHGVPLKYAPLLPLAATGLHAVARLGTVAGKRIAVLGMGVAGQFAARFLHARGARVIVADARAERLANVPGEKVDLSRGGLDELVRDLDAIIEATGRSEELSRCARALRTGGSVVLLSYYEELRVPYAELYFNEIALLATREFAHVDLLGARDAFANQTVDPAPLAEVVISVEDYERAYRTAFDDPAVLKVILAWT